jgi:hypothetical protein
VGQPVAVHALAPPRGTSCAGRPGHAGARGVVIDRFSPPEQAPLCSIKFFAIMGLFVDRGRRPQGRSGPSNATTVETLLVDQEDPAPRPAAGFKERGQGTAGPVAD